MPQRFVGLEIGTHVVRAAELTVGRDLPTLQRYGQVALPVGAVKDGEVVDPPTVAAALRRLWDEAGFSTRDVIVGVGNQRVIVRQADLPAMSEEDLRSALQFQAQELVPIPIDEAILDFQILDEFVNTEQEAMMRILLVAAQREMVRSLLASLEGAGLQASIIDLVPFALMRALLGTELRFDPDSPAAEAIVCIGAGVTNVIVHEQGIPRFVRMLIVGGNDVTEAVASQLGVDFDTAEDLKRRADPESADELEARAGHIVADQALPLLEEIRGSLDYYLAQSEAAEVGRILLTGGGSLLRCLSSRLHDLLGMPVEFGHPLLGLRVGRTGIPEARLIDAEPQVAVPIGLALAGKAPEDGRRRLSLLPSEVTAVREQRRQSVLTGVGVAMLAALLVVLWSAQSPKVTRARHEADAAETETSDVQHQIAALQGATQLDNEVQQRRKMVAAALANDVAWTRLLNSISTVMPNDVWLTAFTANKSAGAAGAVGSVNIGAMGVDGHASAARWLLRAGDLPSLSELWLPSSTRQGASTTPGGQDVVTFSTTANITPKALSNRVARYAGGEQ